MALFKEKKRLGDMLIAEHTINKEQLDQALNTAKSSGKKLGEVLIELGFTSEEKIAWALSRQLRLDKIDMAGINIEEELLNLVSGSILRKHIMIPVEYSKNNPNMVRVAMWDPMDMIAIDDFSIITNRQVEPVIATQREILLALDKYYGDSEAMINAQKYAREREDAELPTPEETAYAEDISSSPIVQLVKAMIEQAARQRASDIHIEALESVVRIRYRIDGVLYEKINYDIRLLAAIIARVKIISGMDISEKRKPQDGRLTMNVDGVEYDIRVSILPTVHGEKCVLRLAQKNVMKREKSQLGLMEEELARFDAMLKNPNGMILVTGPTGSGKSTTLYTALSELNREEVNIITVEDPVEANIDGVNQVQVNAKADLTFASALRSILRQDPDIIMIGEIRDTETAQIAVQASITGHLVVSTLHTNSAAGTVTRLMDMGVESYLLADSLIGVIAQRLVRRLCPHCKRQRETTREERELLGEKLDEPLKIYEPVGCQICNQTGYYDRVGIYEMMPITGKLKEMIAHRENTGKIAEEALKEGMHTLQKSAALNVKNGTTSMEEMMRITFDEQ